MNRTKLFWHSIASYPIAEFITGKRERFAAVVVVHNLFVARERLKRGTALGHCFSVAERLSESGVLLLVGLSSPTGLSQMQCA